MTALPRSDWGASSEERESVPHAFSNSIAARANRSQKRARCPRHANTVLVVFVSDVGLSDQPLRSRSLRLSSADVSYCATVDLLKISEYRASRRGG